MKKLLFSVVIPTRNRPYYLEKLLESLHDECPLSAPMEIIVVDDASSATNSTKNRDLCEHFNIRYAHFSVNKGASAARNHGIKLSTGEWIVFLDDDVTVNKGWYRQLTKELWRFDMTVVGFEGVTVPSGTGIWDREVQNLSGGAYLTSHLGVRRAILESSGLFDEAFSTRGPYCEDHEFAARLLMWGKIPFLKSLSVTHGARTVALIRYLAGAPARCMKLLSNERYFYIKHPDRYHCFRAHHTFFGTLASVMFRNVANNLRRRKIGELLRHPVQTTILVSGSILEQCTAWYFAFQVVCNMLPETSTRFRHSIDLKKTAELWRLPAVRFQQLHLKRHLINQLTFRILRKPVYNLLTPAIALSQKSVSTTSAVYLRIDDVFLADADTVIQCAEVLHRKQFPFLAAVPMHDLLKKEYIPLLSHIRKCGGEIALHGVTHEGNFGPYPSELLQMTFPEIHGLYEKLTTRGLIQDYIPKILVPPFNAIGPEQIVTISRIFPVICGGPETVRFTDHLAGPVALENSAIYFPSLYPFYGSARQFLKNDIPGICSRTNGIICLTTHLAEEAADRFSSFTQLLETLPVTTRPWNRLY